MCWARDEPCKRSLTLVKESSIRGHGDQLCWHGNKFGANGYCFATEMHVAAKCHIAKVVVQPNCSREYVQWGKSRRNRVNLTYKLVANVRWCQQTKHRI